MRIPRKYANLSERMRRVQRISVRFPQLQQINRDKPNLLAVLDAEKRKRLAKEKFLG